MLIAGLQCFVDNWGCNGTCDGFDAETLTTTIVPSDRDMSDRFDCVWELLPK